jgi:hypothetical protein
LEHVWSIRIKLQVEGRTRDLAMFNLAIDRSSGAAMSVDNVYGDRNLVCACAPIETYIKAAE